MRVFLSLKFSLMMVVTYRCEVHDLMPNGMDSCRNRLLFSSCGGFYHFINPRGINGRPDGVSKVSVAVSIEVFNRR